jgi:putative ABC transport system permease protein
MWRATFKAIVAHRWRLIRTAIAVALGVGFVAGTFVVTDTMRSRIDSIIDTSGTGTDVTITSASKFDETGGSTANVEPIDESLLPTILAVDGVRSAAGEVWGTAIIVGTDGKPIQPFGPPTLGAAWGAPSLELEGGAAPTGEWDVVIDVDTAEAQGFRIGDTVRVILQDSSKEFRVVGFVHVPDAWTGATLAVFSVPTAQRLMEMKSEFNSISVDAEPGVSPEALRERILAVVPGRTDVKTWSEVSADAKESLGQIMGIFESVLLAFALVALFVGCFLIFNTFSIMVAQRTREVGLLRAIGASKRQIVESVLVESAVLGLLAAAFGLVVGVLLAMGLFELMKGGSSSSMIAGTSLQVTPRTVVVALVTGVVVTVVAALMPARRAAGVAPVVAIDGRVEERPGATRRRVLLGGIVTAVGLAAILAGLFTDVPHPTYLVGTGALLLFIGLAILSVLFARPLAAFVGRPLALAFGEPAYLGRENAMRSPRRTATTASALMIGVALVAFVTIVASSIKASANSVIDRDLHADYVIQPSSMSAGFQQAGVSPGIADALAHDLTIAEVSEIRTGQFGLDGVSKTLFAVDPFTLPHMLSFDDASLRSLSALNDVGVLVRRRVAEDEGWRVGDNVPMQYQRVGTVQTPIQGLFDSDALNGADYLITIGEYDHRYVQRMDAQVFVKATAGASHAEIQAAIDEALGAYPNVTAMDRGQYADAQARQIDSLLVFVQALLGLSVIIALLGIANTLGMSILERRRELGLLRAVGMTRGQLRAMVRWEAVIIGVIGALLGLAVGTFFGWALVRALRDQGFTEFAVPFARLLVYVVLGAIAGVVAAIVPARRAARLNVLEAIATE